MRAVVATNALGVVGARLLGKGVLALLIAWGLLLVGGAIDILPYVGSPQFDYPGMDVSRPFWPQALRIAVPLASTGALMAVLSLAGVKGRFVEDLGPGSLARIWFGWALAAFGFRLLWSVWAWSPLDPGRLVWIARYAATNAATSATLLLGAAVFLALYARWPARPGTRWGELALWFAVSTVLIVGLLCVMTIVGGLNTSLLFTDAWQMALTLAAPLAVCAATAPRASSDGRPARAGRRGGVR